VEQEKLDTKFVTIKDIVEKLKVSRNFIYKRILVDVEYQRRGSATFVNKAMLCDWLMENVEFTRQTVRVPVTALTNYAEKFKQKYPADFFATNIEGMVMDRSKLPFRTVRPFNIWEEAERGKLLHAKLMVGTSHKTADLLYKDMFSSGAIKIKLGINKTFFFIPEGDGVLCPAMDDEAEDLIKGVTKAKKTFGAMIRAKGDQIMLQNLINLLRHHYRIEDSYIQENNFEFVVSKIFEVAHEPQNSM